MIQNAGFQIIFPVKQLEAELKPMQCYSKQLLHSYGVSIPFLFVDEATAAQYLHAMS
jgi:hypothetical protein